MTWQIVLDVIQDVRGSVGMYLFIIEEAIQTLGMAMYLLYKAQKYDDVRTLGEWILNEVINPAIDFNNTYGVVAYPLNQCYDVFYKAAKKNIQTYLDVVKGK